jgi:nucleoside-diphosphate-sugar epimerase
VLETARLTGVAKTIFSSTSAVYERTSTTLHSETDPLDPDLVYALSKTFAEALCRAYTKNYGMNIIICRFFNVYGPHQDFLRPSPPFTSYLAREVVAGRVPIIYNSSDVKRDYVHINDVIDLLTRMMRAERHYAAEVFNVASGTGYSVPEIWHMMQKVSGRQIEPEFRSPETFWDAYPVLFEGPRPLSRGRIRDEVYKEALGDNTRTRAEFDWSPNIDLETGLRSVYDYARAHLPLGS